MNSEATVADIDRVRIEGLHRVVRALVAVALVLLLFMGAIVALFIVTNRDNEARIADICHESQKSWDGRQSLALTIWAPPGSTPTSQAVISILERVGFTPADVATLVANGADRNAQRLAAFNKIDGPRPTCP